MIVLDTTVLAYSVGAEHPLATPCRELVSAIGQRQIRATTTVEVIQEFAHVRARRRGREDAQALAIGFVDLLSPLLTTGEHQLRSGLDLWGRHDRLGAFDAVLAAVAKAAGATVLVSADGAFAGITGVAHVVPDAPGVRHLLDGETRPT